MRKALTREAILDAAIEILDRDGMSGLSMRKLGTAVGVEAMSLYNHVPNKDALLDGIHERMRVLACPYRFRASKIRGTRRGIRRQHFARPRSRLSALRERRRTSSRARR